MKNEFRIGDTKSFLEKDKMAEITDVELEKYQFPGVWVLFGRKVGKPWLCFQVGQSNNIGIEIKSDIQSISGRIEEQIEKSYINQFGESIKGYDYTIYLTPREQIYKKLGEQYKEFAFICICYGIDYKDNKKLIEKYVAWKLKAMFWRNGRPYKQPKKNVEKPQDINKISFDKIEDVKKMVAWYENQKSNCMKVDGIYEQEK